jgi:hypothetical protein
MRSPNYPAIGLTDAIRLARVLWQREQRASVAPEVAVVHFGYQGLNGPSRSKLSALRKYGLLEDGKNGVLLTERALTILHSGEDSPAYRSAVANAASTPELFAELLENMPNASEQNIGSYLKVKRGFSDAGAKIAIAAFRDTLAFRDASRGSGYTDAKSEAEAGDGLAAMTVAGDPGQRPPQSPQSPSGRTVVWLKTEPLGDDKVGEIRVVGGAGSTATPDDLEWLIEAMQLTLKRLKARGTDDGDSKPI